MAGYATGEDKPRNERMRKVQVSCAVRHCVLPGGHLAKFGDDNEFMVYESDIPKIQALVEPEPHLIDQAKRWVASRAAELEGQRRVHARERFWQAAFRYLNHRGVKPLRAAVVSEETFAPPLSEAEAKARMMVSEMGSTQASALLDAMRMLLTETRRDDSDDRKPRRG